MPKGDKLGRDLPQLRGGVLKELRHGAAESSVAAIRDASLSEATADTARLRIMEGAFSALKATPGFDPRVAGSASFKLKW